MNNFFNKNVKKKTFKDYLNPPVEQLSIKNGIFELSCPYYLKYNGSFFCYNMMDNKVKRFRDSFYLKFHHKDHRHQEEQKQQRYQIIC